MAKPRCVCGCGQRSANRHHLIYQQHIREAMGPKPRGDVDAEAEWSARLAKLLKDERNLVWMAFGCHAAHHSGAARLPLWSLPDEVVSPFLEFAAELLGPEAAYEYIRRRYWRDDRLSALLEVA